MKDLKLSDKKILITGGAGFIGSYLVEKLCMKNKVTVIDNLSTGKQKNISKLLDKIKFIKTNLNNYKFKSSKFDLVIHLAAQTSVPYSVKNFKLSSKINMDISINVLDYCYKNQVPFVYASSSAIYGNLKYGDDTKNLFDLINPYAADKMNLENYATSIFNLKKISNIGLRFFNVYGGRQDPNSIYSGVISIFLNSAKNNSVININGGKQTRDFIYVGDVVDSIIKASKLVLNKNICEKVNILTGKSTSINSLFKIISTLTNYKKSPINKKMLLGDPIQSTGSINKMKKILLNNKNFINLKNGLKLSIEESYNNEIR